MAALERCKPILEKMKGWSSPTAGATDFSKLPKEAVAYVHRIQELIGCPIDVISTGPHRDEVIRVREVIGV